jgi:hypothetical protein
MTACGLCLIGLGKVSAHLFEDRYHQAEKLVGVFGGGADCEEEYFLDTGKGIMRRFEKSLLGGIPQYQLMKSVAEGLARVENAEGVKPALVSIEGGWQMGYLLESLENGWVTVFLPQAPTPMSGNVMYLPVGRVRLLGISMVTAMAIVKHMGVGSDEALRGADLTLPAGA